MDGNEIPNIEEVLEAIKSKINGSTITKELPNKPGVIQVIYKVESNKWDIYEVDCLLKPNPHEYAKSQVLNYINNN